MIFGHYWNNSAKQEEAAQKPNYTDLSEDALLDKFKTEQWNQLDEENRIALFQEMEDRNAKSDGREAAKVEALHSARSYGCYNDTNNTLSINVDKSISSYETLDTYQHEMTHGEQTRNLEANTGYDDHTASMMKAECTRDKDGYLIAYASGGKKLDDNGVTEYDVQCNEMDSNQKAAEFLMSQKERYQGDPEYSDYIKSRLEHFESVNEAIENNGKGRCALEQRQAKIGYDNKALTKEEFTALSEDLNNADYKDASTKKNEEIATQLKAVDKELDETQETNVDQEETLDADNDHMETLEVECDDEIEYLGFTPEESGCGVEAESSENYVGSVDTISTEPEQANTYTGEIAQSSTSSVETGSSMDNSNGMA